jgi:hypothetical protein
MKESATKPKALSGAKRSVRRKGGSLTPGTVGTGATSVIAVEVEP